MKIAIISDIHDNLENLKIFLNWAGTNSVNKIFCLGDLTNFDTLKFLAQNFKDEIYLIKGNITLFSEEEADEFKNINFLGEINYFELNNKKIGLCHEPFFIDKLLEKYKCDIIFYGHTHRPWIEEKDACKIVNPGTLGGVFQKASFAVWDIGKNKLDLKILEKL